jgi:ABC-type phosphate transport system substrate-binding protein
MQTLDEHSAKGEMLMKSLGCLVAATMLIGFVIAGVCGCANQQSATTASTNPAERTYSGQDLQRTGKTTPAEQLQAADPSITTRGDR